VGIMSKVFPEPCHWRIQGGGAVGEGSARSPYWLFSKVPFAANTTRIVPVADLGFSEWVTGNPTRTE